MLLRLESCLRRHTKLWSAVCGVSGLCVVSGMWVGLQSGLCMGLNAIVIRDVTFELEGADPGELSLRES